MLSEQERPDMAVPDGTVPDDCIARLHGTLEASRANGPGLRSVVWFQGCTLGCRGCFNPETHGSAAGWPHSVAALVDELAALEGTITGVTISGGEPFQQPQALRALVSGLRARTGLSILLFSGYRREEIEALPHGAGILECIDVLVAGRYLPSRHLGEGLLGSANQEVHLLTGRYCHGDLAATPPGEVVIDTAGRVTVTGVLPPAFPEA